MEEYRKTDGYKQWLIDSREQRRTLKEKYRRQKGSQSIDKIRKKHDSHVRVYEKQLAKAEALKGKALDHSAHVDCWRALTDSERQVAKRKRIRAVEVRIVAFGENADRKVDALAIDSGEKIQPGHSAPRINSGITGLPFIGT